MLYLLPSDDLWLSISEPFGCCLDRHSNVALGFREHSLKVASFITVPSVKSQTPFHHDADPQGLGASRITGMEIERKKPKPYWCFQLWGSLIQVGAIHSLLQWSPLEYKIGVRFRASRVLPSPEHKRVTAGHFPTLRDHAWLTLAPSQPSVSSLCSLQYHSCYSDKILNRLLREEVLFWPMVL